MSEAVAQRLLDSEAKLDDPAQALRLSELYGTLHAAIWSELAGPARTSRSLRRNLQREHASRLATALLRPVGVDARRRARAAACGRAACCAPSSPRRRARPDCRRRRSAHLDETLATLDEALKAPIVRQAV